LSHPIRYTCVACCAAAASATQRIPRMTRVTTALRGALPGAGPMVVSFGSHACAASA